MATISVTVRSNVPRVIAEKAAKAALITHKAALDVEARAKQLAPVDTGNLRNSINTQGAGVAYVVESPVEYSIYQEFGTRKMAAQPYMLPAAEYVRPRYLAALKAL